jgi:hypothetical protein
VQDVVSPAEKQAMLKELEKHDGVFVPALDIDETRMRQGNKRLFRVRRCYMKCALILLPDDASDADPLSQHEYDHWEAAQDALDAINEKYLGSKSGSQEDHGPDQPKGKDMTSEERAKMNKEGGTAVKEAGEALDKETDHGNPAKPWSKVTV